MKRTEVIERNGTITAAMEAVGRQIKSRREQLGLTQKELGREVGLTNQSILRIEQGRQNVDFMGLCQLSGVLGIAFTISAMPAPSNSRGQRASILIPPPP